MSFVIPTVLARGLCHITARPLLTSQSHPQSQTPPGTVAAEAGLKVTDVTAVGAFPGRGTDRHPITDEGTGRNFAFQK